MSDAAWRLILVGSVVLAAVAPLIVVRASDGGMVGRIVGKPSPGRIGRLLRDAGVK
jgi:hypothetical protein